jgi:GxxExxY protein
LETGKSPVATVIADRHFVYELAGIDMPVTVQAETRLLDDNEFAHLVYDVMRHVFAVRKQFGRFFDENIYHFETARRSGGLMKVPVEVVHGDFRKLYFLDLLVGGGAIFELKVAETLTPRHRSQLLQYLMLADLPRGKLVNLRTESVEHEFINSKLSRAERSEFTVVDSEWGFSEHGITALRGHVVDLLRDLGTGLDVGLYEEILSHILGGEQSVLEHVEIFSEGTLLDRHPVRLANSSCNFKVTAVRESDLPHTETHLRQFLNHTRLAGTHWINIRHHRVTLKTLRPDPSE